MFTTGFQNTTEQRRIEDGGVKAIVPDGAQKGGMLADWKLAYRISEACAAIGVKRSKLYELIKAGRLAIRKADGCTLILKSELERYLDNLPLGAAA